MPSAHPLVSIVVTVKDAADALPDLLSDFSRLTWPPARLELVLVDGGSRDRTVGLANEWARTAPFHMRVLEKTGGISVGRNEGFRNARGEFVAVTDADMRVPPDWIDQLMAGMSEDTIGVVGGPNETARNDLISRCVATIPTHGPSLGSVFLFSPNPYPRDFTTDRDVYAAVTRNSLFRKRAFEEAGGFDERLVVTEDPELNYRILQAGFRLRYRRAARVEHVHRDTLGSFYRQQRGYAYWQAHVNRKHRALWSVKHPAPALGALLVLLLAGLSPVSPYALVGAVTLAIGALLFTFLYTLRAVLVKRDAALLLVLPIYFLAWQWAWITGYPAGAWRARRAG